ncbi:unnamed protein product [Hymenolepis diminuta]|uniref:Uncharacterized protein n=1 Tax=Hymenolepis diminuta TaxID=6216 RepID=A0A0R3SDQ1_HYMDI|nr:unnamed protein product [Hymenolepis diminuta]
MEWLLVDPKTLDFGNLTPVFWTIVFCGMQFHLRTAVFLSSHSLEFVVLLVAYTVDDGVNEGFNVVSLLLVLFFLKASRNAASAFIGALYFVIDLLDITKAFFLFYRYMEISSVLLRPPPVNPDYTPTPRPIRFPQSRHYQQYFQTEQSPTETLDDRIIRNPGPVPSSTTAEVSLPPTDSAPPCKYR